MNLDALGLKDDQKKAVEQVIASIFARRVKERDALRAVVEAFGDVLPRARGVAALQALQDRFACVAAVRGKGLLAAMEFDSDIAGRVVTHANKAGVLLNAVRPNAVRFMPPLTITVEEVDEAAERLEKALQQL